MASFPAKPRNDSWKRLTLPSWSFSPISGPAILGPLSQEAWSQSNDQHQKCAEQYKRIELQHHPIERRHPETSVM